MMFEEIFLPQTAEKYRAAPLVEQRERYLVYLKAAGARRQTLRKCANDQFNLVSLLELKDGARVRVSQIEAATAIWSRPKGPKCSPTTAPKARRRFVNHAIQWLHFLEWLDESEVSRHPYGAEVATFEAWMSGDRGLSKATIRDYRTAADQFFEWLATTEIPLASVKIADIDDAIAAKKARGTWGAGRCTITPSVFVRSFVLLRRAAGARVA
jgi:integrase/recombinase XerD